VSVWTLSEPLLGLATDLVHAPQAAPAHISTAFIAAVFVSAACGSLGCYVVVRRMAFIGDAMAHTVLPGLVVAAMLGWSLSIGGLIAGLLTALGIGWLASRGQLREDTAIGVLFTAMFALGIVLSSHGPGAERLGQMLFGDLTAVDMQGLGLLLAIALVSVLILTLLHKELELASCDPAYAEVIGIRTGRLRYILLITLALAIIAGVQAVGVLLTAALLVTPAAAASLLTRSLPRMMVWAVAIATVCSAVGLISAITLRVAPGPAIVLTCTAAFGLAWLGRAVRRRV
jgi:ABC-type Mn2+/Zn2+ transport system permease subunit